MDILVKHNGTNITEYVLSYEREHRICTGIGTLTIEFPRTINRTFDPWDSIDIHENGDFKVRYYVSAVTDTSPEGKVIVDCQDLSKKLVDFFIPESYIIETPSYTRTWIELFLDMADVEYEFTVDSPGNLLSNMTQLGLQPAYEQILLLLQLSGWYMYFDGNGKAIIGTLTTNLADTTNNVGKDDVLSISKVSDDKMLRNRALVLGAFDVYSMTYAAADVTVHTRWNYDRNDVRAMVVANSNIPNRGSAYSIANMLLKEFARITEVKTIELWGARNFNLGDACRATTNVWRGKGLITTFGVRMSKDGLITTIVLDERCPRLFGFFDFGDYVYVGTFGDGVWRKHLKFDHTWHNFSTGLDELRITDLHLINGSFGAVGASGQMYYAYGEDGPWNKITITGLMSSENATTSSGIVNYIGFSGIMGRAVIVDKLSNIVKFGVDTWSGLNMGDYFLNMSGWMGVTAFSGIMSSGIPATASGSRGWILHYDPLTGLPTGGLGSGVYPIHYSGNYNVRVIDIENDGFNDFVSVKVGEGFESSDTGYTLGRYGTAPLFDTYDSRAYSVEPSIIPPEERFIGIGPTVRDPQSMLFIDNGVSGERVAVTIDKSNIIRRVLFELDIDGNAFGTETSLNITGGGTTTACIHYVNSSVYRVISYTITTVGTKKIEVYSLDWNVVSNTTAGWTLVHTFLYGSLNPRPNSNVIAVQNTAYILTQAGTQTVNAGGFNVNPVFSNLYTTTINLLSGAASTVVVMEFESEKTAPADSTYEYIRGDSSNSAADKDHSYINTHFVQTGDNNVEVIGWFCYGYQTITEMKEIIITGTPNQLVLTELYSDMTPRFQSLGSQAGDNTINSATQLSRDKGMITRVGGASTLGFAFNGSTFATFTGATPPVYLQPRNVFPVYGTGGDSYIVRDGTTETWYKVSATSLSIQQVLTPPTGYSFISPFSYPTAFSNYIWWLIEDDMTSARYLVPATNTSEINLLMGYQVYGFGASLRRGTNVGGFFIKSPSNWNAAFPTIDVEYIYWGPGELPSSSYMVLQREEMEYTLIEQESYPIRIDISNSSPVLAVGSGDLSFKSNYVYPDSVEQIFVAFSSGVRQVNDYRYTLLEPTYSGILASGLGVEQLGLYVYGSGVFGQNIRSYSGGWQSIFDVPSGWGTRIETSNYGRGGQYVFVTASGFVQTFFQKDPEMYGFVSHSGMPQSRATIIRLDDRV
jgi:hypothetical protein